MNKKVRNNLIGEFKGRLDTSRRYLDFFFKDGVNLKDFQNYTEVGNKVWYSGQSAMLRAFYQRSHGKVAGFQPMENSFWRNVCGDVSIVHVPVASSISETMSNVLFGRLPSILADTKNKTTNKKIDARMEEIFDFNNLAHSLQTASQLESYSGTVAGRIIVDPDFDKPIIEWFPAEFIEENSKFGRVCEVIFTETINRINGEKAEKFTLKTIAGYGYIRYELWLEDKIVPLTELEQTSKLKDMYFVDENGEPIPFLMCIWKPNRVANNLFCSQKGDSDYTGLWDLFDSIDESASAMTDNIKKSRTYTFIPERMLQKDEFGNVAVNKAYGIDVWDVNKVAEQNEKLPSRDYVPISVSAYIESIRWFVKECLNRVGLSPTTFGMDDAGANASGEALNIRDSRTEKTFKDKSNLWKPALENMARLLYIFDYVKNQEVEKNGETIIIPSSILNVKFTAQFPPFREISPNDKFKAWMDMLDNGAMSVEYAMEDALRGEIPDADIDLIKEQLGMGKEEEPPTNIITEPTEDEEEE